MAVLRVNGGRPLCGEITVRGAKNLVPKAMVAALLSAESSTLASVPDIRDVEVVTKLLSLHGVKVNFDKTARTLELDSRHIYAVPADQVDQHAGSSRIPILLCGPLLHRLGHAVIPNLGGCNIGGRPIDFHLQTLRAFGAEIEKLPHGIELRAPHGLEGTKVELPYPSVGATEQTLLTAVRARGITELRGAAVEPEIMDLVAVLQKMGAIISVDTDRVIRVEGVEELRGFQHKALPDRIEAASWAAAALATNGDITVHGARQQDMMTFLNVFRKVGGDFDISEDAIRFRRSPGGKLKSIVLETNVHPGFMTDWQQPLVVALTQAEGLSIVHETVYENRFGFTEALRRMGAHIQVYRECLGGLRCRFGARNFYHSAVISGPSPLVGAQIDVPDLRGGFSHVVAALAARGTSRVSGVDIINRGYEDFMHKLAALDADVELTK